MQDSVTGRVYVFPCPRCHPEFLRSVVKMAGVTLFPRPLRKIVTTVKGCAHYYPDDDDDTLVHLCDAEVEDYLTDVTIEDVLRDAKQK